jgi:transcriptional regulator with XRE-family HTH domain
MSQDALAELTGYKDRSSIAKIEKGEVDISESKIREFAKALRTTPQELMGWDEMDTPYSGLNVQDTALASLFHNYDNLNAEGREKLIDYSDDLVRSNKYQKFISNRVLQEEA